MTMTNDFELSVSVALAVYKGEKFIKEQLKSIFEQTIVPQEIVIFDDSDDKATELAIQQVSKYSPCPLLYFHNPFPLKVTKNFEKAVSKCTGDIIFFCDQDDIWEKNKIEVFKDFFKSHVEYVAVFSDGYVVDPDLKPFNYSLWDMLFFSKSEQDKFYRRRGFEVLLRHIVSSGNTMAFRSEIKKAILPFPEMHSCHDSWTALIASAIGKVSIIPDKLIRYRLHQDNLIGQQKPGLFDKVKLAKRQLKINIFEYNLELAQKVKERLECLEKSGYKVSDTEFRLISEKIKHYTIRINMSRFLIFRISAILKEWLRGRYRKYSYGVGSILQDIFLR